MSAPGPAILLTGATGYLGKHILWQLLQNGYQVSVLVRRKRECPGKRVIDALNTIGPFDDKFLDVIEGDLTESDCEIDSSVLQKLSETGIRVLIHCAALTRFDAHLSDEIYRSNLLGTKNAYTLASQLGIKNFNYISTAYVAGNTLQVFKGSDLDVGQGFNNPYEASKYDTEKYLRDACKTDATRVTVYRPSIVVGGHPLGDNNTVSTVYTFIKVLHFIRECCRRDLQRGRGKYSRCGVRHNGNGFFIPLRIAADPKISINLISVDSVVNRIIKGLESSNDKYAVIPILGDDYSLDKLNKAISSVLGIEGITLVENNSFKESPMTAVEQNFYRATSSYQPYLFTAPDFQESEKDKTGNINIERLTVDFINSLDLKISRKRPGDLNRLALNTLAVSGPRDYFHLFINGQIGKSFLNRITYIDTKIRFLVCDDNVFDQVIHFDKGNIHYACGKDFDCSYELEPPVFNDIVNGRLNLKDAFFDGKIRIKGDRETALKFGYLFSDHFLNIDNRVTEEVVGQ